MQQTSLRTAQGTKTTSGTSIERLLVDPEETVAYGAE